MPDPVRITFLGGLGEIGRNCAAFEQDGRILLLDCGLMFPDAEMLGIDLVLPDFTWLRENASRIEGCIVTHGHDDHVGGLSFLLLSDSTNAEEPGHTPSERSVGHVLRNLFRDNEGKRIIAACFASHIHRIQQIAEAALATDRTVATLGRSMAKNVGLARQMGLLHIPDDRLVDIERLDDLDPAKVLVLSTGSQGEPMSALALMAAGENKWLKIGEGDVVILSSHAIPGNEHSVNKVIDGLCRLGADVA